MRSWFERQAAGRSEAEVTQEHARYLRAAGVDRALEALAGPFGLRRFLVVFAVRSVGGPLRVQVEDIVAVGLVVGGGPPPPDPAGQRLAELERALERLHRNMSTGPRWSRGVLGYVRDSAGRATILPLFDEDSDQATLEALPVPTGPPHPLETPEYRDLLANWEPRVAALHARTSQIRADWDLWTVEEDQLVLCYDPVEGQAEQWREVRRARCEPLATFSQRRQRLTWQTARRPGSPALFREDVVAADWDAALELCLLTAAGLGCGWLFVGEYGEHGAVLVAGVWE